MIQSDTNTFTCWKCQNTFPKEWTDAEAEKEYSDAWGPNMGEEREVLCDDCNAEFLKWYKDHHNAV